MTKFAPDRKVEQADISERCYHCGERIGGEDVVEVQLRYSAHVKDEHGKPDHVADIPGREWY